MKYIFLSFLVISFSALGMNSVYQSFLAEKQVLLQQQEMLQKKKRDLVAEKNKLTKQKNTWKIGAIIAGTSALATGTIGISKEIQARKKKQEAKIKFPKASLKNATSNQISSSANCDQTFETAYWDDKIQTTKIHLAIKENDFNLFKNLIESCPNIDIDLADSNKWTFLHYATQHSDSKIFNYLIEKGANINAQGLEGESVLILATYFRNKSAIRSLDELRVNKSLKTNEGKTACLSVGIFKAAKDPEFEVMKKILCGG